MTIEDQFNDFIATGILDEDENEFAEYETCIQFENHIPRELGTVLRGRLNEWNLHSFALQEHF